MKRGLLITTAVIGGLVAVVALFISWLLLTESGLRFALGRAAALSPVPLSAADARGRLAGRVSLSGIEIGDESARARIGAAEMELLLSRLLAGRLQIKELDLSGIDVAIAPDDTRVPDEAPARLQPPEPALPLGLAAGRITARDVRIRGLTEEAILIDSAAVDGLTYASRAWRVESFEFRSPAAGGQGDLYYLAEAGHDVTFNFKGFLQLNENKLNIDTNISGDEERLRLLTRLGEAVDGELAAAVDEPFLQPRWSLSGSVSAASLKQLAPGWPEQGLKLNMEAVGGAEEAEASGSFTLTGQPELGFDARLGRAEAGMALTGFTLRERGGEARVTFAGNLLLAPGLPPVDGRLSWIALRWPLEINEGEQALLASPAGEMTLSGQAGRYRLAGAGELASGEGSGKFAATANLDLDKEQPAVDVEGNWESLALNLRGRALASPEGRFSLAGSGGDFRFGADLSLEGPGWPAARVEASGKGTGDTVTVERFKLRSEAGELDGSGEIRLAAERPFRFKVSGRSIDPGKFSEPWYGQLDFNSSVEGSIPSEGLQAGVALERLRGSLRDQPLMATAGFDFRRERLRVRELDASWGDARARAGGRIGPELDFGWSVSVPDLGRLTGVAQGRISSEGRLTGSRSAPGVAGKLEASGFSAGEWSAAAVSLDVDVDLAGERDSKVTGVASDLRLAGRPVSEVRLAAAGAAADHSIALFAASGEKNSLDTRARGSWRNGSWQARLSEARLRIAGDTWTQAGTAPVTASARDWSLQELCLELAPASVCVDARAESERPAQVNLEASNVPLERLRFVLPGGLTYGGQMSARASMVLHERVPRLDATFAVTDGRVAQRTEDEPIELLDFRSMSGKANLADGRLRVYADMLEPDGPELSGSLDLPMQGWSPGAGRIGGEINGTLGNLGVLSLLMPELASPEGRLSARLDVGGTMEAPRFEGNAELRDGSVIVPALGIRLQDLGARIDAEGRQLRFSSSGKSGSGTLDLSGELELAQAGARGRVTLSGAAFLASDLPEARVLLSPSLALQLDGRNLRLTGEVIVPEAHIAPRDVSLGVQRTPDEIVMDAEGQPARPDGWAVSSQVRVELGDRVSFEGYGLKASLAGAVTVLDEPGKVTTATGELKVVEGTYGAYGKELEVRRGRLLFTGGPLNNPGLDVLALRKVREDIEVGVTVRATLRQPELRLYSQPGLPPTQMLSYLLVGQSFADASGDERQLVSDTATRLATAGGNLIAQQLGRRFGLDDVSLQRGTGSDQASLVIGRYLSPRLYASYGIGLFEPLSTLRFRYTISSRWKLRAESGLSQSLDLEYVLEK